LQQLLPSGEKVLFKEKNNLGKLKGYRILVTGGTGFVGANVVRRLVVDGADVSVMVRPGADLWRLADLGSQIHWSECNLLDFVGVGKCVASIKPDLIYHAAFPGGHDPAAESQIDILSTGLLGTFHLLNAAWKNKVNRFIHIGSSTEYHPASQPHREDELIQPVSIRGVGKAASALLCQQYAHQNNLPLVILRLFTVYGPWEQPKRLIPVACRAIYQNETLPLTPSGLMHDWVLVDDVVDACLQAASLVYPSGEIINVGSGEQHSNEEIVQILGDIAGKDVKVANGAYKPRSFDTTNWVADISKASKLLRWHPKHSLRSGLEITYRFWCKLISSYGGEFGH
jgi:nucleoside-diphosphate-sugar epimerase